MNEEEIRRLWRIFGRNIIRDDDGYFIYWPTENLGAYNAPVLRSLADLLDVVNATWDARMERYFKKHWPPVAPDFNVERL